MKKQSKVNVQFRLSAATARRLKASAKVRGLTTSELVRQILSTFVEHWRLCRVCGCHQNDACYHEGMGTCEWEEQDLCTFCAAIAAGGLKREDVEQPADRAAFRKSRSKSKRNFQRPPASLPIAVGIPSGRISLFQRIQHESHDRFRPG